MTQEITQVPCVRATTHNPATHIMFSFNHPVLCSFTTLCHLHTYSLPISCAKVLILSLLSRYPIYLPSGSRKRILVYSTKTTGPIPSMLPDFYFHVQCLLADESYLMSTERNYSFFFVHFVECLGSIRLIRPSKSPFSLTIHCLFMPWLHARQSSLLNCHQQQLHLPLWDDPMPKLLVA